MVTDLGFIDARKWILAAESSRDMAWARYILPILIVQPLLGGACCGNSVRSWSALRPMLLSRTKQM